MKNQRRSNIPRRALCVALTVILLLGMLPLTALAATTDIPVSDGKVTVLAHSGTITVEQTGEVFSDMARVERGTAVTVALDETAYPGKTFTVWKGDDGTQVPKKTFRLLVERNTAFYPVFSDLTGSFGAWSAVAFGPLCTDGILYVREDAASGLKEYKWERELHSFGRCSEVNDAEHRVVCTKCGYAESDPHRFDGGVVTTDPGHTAEGVKTYTCYDCGAVKTEPVEKTADHVYGEWIIDTEATGGNPGLRHRTCACGDTQTSYYIKAEWEQYLQDRYLYFDRTCTKAMAFGNTQDEWFYAYKNSDGNDSYVYVVKQDTGDRDTYAFLFIDDPTLAKKPVYVARLTSGSSYHSMFDWALHCYVKSTGEYFALIDHLDMVFGTDSNSGTYASTMMYMFGFWEDIYNGFNPTSPDWWQDSFTREEVEHCGFDCWKYTSKDESNPKYYYVIKDSNVCIYHYNPVSKDGYNLLEMRNVQYDVDFSGMTEEEKTAWYGVNYDAADIGTTGSPARFGKEKPEAVSGYRVAVTHLSQSNMVLSNEYEWRGYSSFDERDRFKTVFTYPGELSEYISTDTGRSFRLTPLSSDYYTARYVFDHWERYNFDTEEWEFYSGERDIDLNYILVEDERTEDHRIDDIQYFRGVYGDRLYHVSVEGGFFTYNGVTLREGDVPYEAAISLTYDSEAVPDGYYFDCFKDAGGNSLYYGDYTGITVQSDLAYSAVYGECAVTDPTYYVSVSAENGTVTMGGKEFYGGDFPAGTELTLSTAGEAGFTTFLGWYLVEFDKNKQPVYTLLSTDNPYTYEVTSGYDQQLAARWSDGAEPPVENKHNITAVNGFVRGGYDGLAVSAIRVPDNSEVMMTKDPTDPLKVKRWVLTGTLGDGTPVSETKDDSEYGTWFLISGGENDEKGNPTQAYPTEITITGEADLCAEHTWDEGVITTKPTYVTEGVRTYTCDECGTRKREPVPCLERYCVHACLRCGGCTLEPGDGSCHFDRCVCGESTRLPVTDGPEISVEYDGAGSIQPVIYTVSCEENRENPYVNYVLQATDGFEIEGLFDISLTDEEGGKYVLGVGETITITLTVGSANAQAILDGRLTLIHITDNGNVLYGRGYAPITADVEAGTVTFTADSCSPFVLARSASVVTGLTLDKTIASVETADCTLTLTPVFTPDTASQELTWESSDNSIATVSGGVVTLLKKGVVTITATTEDGAFSASCVVTVRCSHGLGDDVPAEGSTCTKHGHGAYTVCGECGEVIDGSDAELPLAPHNFTENAASQYLKSAATCSARAVYYKSCSVCGEKAAETFEAGGFDDTNHVGETDIKDQKPATEQEKGYTGDTWCRSCGKKTASGRDIDKLEHRPVLVKGEAASAAEEGSITHYHCENCGKYFTDEAGTREISREETVIPKLPPKILEGSGVKIDKTSKEPVSFRSDAAFADFLRVELDGTVLVRDRDYTLREGSIIAVLTPEFAASLSEGEHTLGIVSVSGTATAVFTVTAGSGPEQPPQTGDNSGIVLWSVLAVLSLTAACATVLVFRKKEMR